MDNVRGENPAIKDMQRRFSWFILKTTANSLSEDDARDIRAAVQGETEALNRAEERDHAAL